MQPRVVITGWLILVIVGILSTILALVAISEIGAIVTGGFVIITWICWGAWTSWRYGTRRHVLNHLGGEPDDWQVITHVIPTTERVNVQLALDQLRGSGPKAWPVLGLRLFLHESSSGSSEIIALVRTNPWPEPLQWESFPRSLKEKMNCATNALYLLRWDGVSFCALLCPRTQRSRKQMELHILATNRDDAERALAIVLDTADQKSIYRGSILSLRPPEDRREEFSIRFSDLAPVKRDAIVLPQEVMTVV